MKIAIISGESVWPALNGGQVRVSGIVEILAESHDIFFLAPSDFGEPELYPVGVKTISRSLNLKRNYLGFLSKHPRIGRYYFSRENLLQISSYINTCSPDIVLFTHSYLADMVQTEKLIRIVDFPNIEMERWKSFSQFGSWRNRTSAFIEGSKARFWEPRVARGADVCLSCTTSDQKVLDAWGGTSLYIPNGTFKNLEPMKLSPEFGRVLYVSSADYTPNRIAGEWLLREVWPLISRQLPNTVLTIAGTCTSEVFNWAKDQEGVEVLGEVNDIYELFDSAALVVAPVQHGGGQQLKIVDALSRRRILVATPYSARSIPEYLSALYDIAETPEQFSNLIVKLVRNPVERWKREESISSDKLVKTWQDSLVPLLDWLSTKNA